MPCTWNSFTLTHTYFYLFLSRFACLPFYLYYFVSRFIFSFHDRAKCLLSFHVFVTRLLTFVYLRYDEFLLHLSHYLSVSLSLSSLFFFLKRTEHTRGYFRINLDTRLKNVIQHSDYSDLAFSFIFLCSGTTITAENGWLQTGFPRRTESRLQ